LKKGEVAMSVDLEAMERRLAALETAVAELQQRVSNGQPASSPNWIEQTSGIITHTEVFEEMMKYAREYRNADRPPDESEEPAA
jgi:hypothetical protein